MALPGHMHLVLTLPPDTADFSVRLRLMKLLFAKGLPRDERLSDSRLKRKERGLWQRRFWEHAIRHARDYSPHIDYCHWNPLKLAYVQ
ncbi:MAG: REP-associated tyrosine transposase [Methylomonas sp.]